MKDRLVYFTVAKSPTESEPCRLFEASIDKLWKARYGITEPHRPELLPHWDPMLDFVESVLAGKPDTRGPYYRYLVWRQHRKSEEIPFKSFSPETPPVQAGKIEYRLASIVELAQSIRDSGLRNPLDFYLFNRGATVEHGAILLRGYRRLPILKALNHDRVPCRCFVDRDVCLAAHY